MNGFKLPQNTPQDLLLILDLIGVPRSDVPPLTSSSQIVKSAVVQTDDIDSSDSEIASEDEIEADLIPINYEDELQEPKTMHVVRLFPFTLLTVSTVWCHQILAGTRTQAQTQSLV
jgi:H/ACA ribonucleoprotein complex non-core subunit NAF1